MPRTIGRITTRDYQDVAHDRVFAAWEEHRSCLVVMPCRTGKCLGKGTPVMLVTGKSKPVEDIAVGDVLMGPDSSGRIVRSLARGREMMYRVVPKKGDAYEVNESHILSLKMGQGASKGDGSRGGEYTAGNIINISVRDYLQRSKTFKAYAKGWRAGVEFPNIVTPLDPYFLGLWLGDGTRANTGISKPDPEILAYLVRQAAMYTDMSITTQGGEGKCPTHSLVTPRGKPNPIWNTLKALGVTEEKHVPHKFKMNTQKVRLSLLAGLMDSDGHLTCNGFEYVSKDQRLADDVVWLARSVGLAAYVSISHKTCQTGAGGNYYRVSISGHTDRIPTLIRRKQAKPRQRTNDVLLTGIEVEEIGEDDYYGFEIDGDRLFLLGDFTVTHNTTVAASIIHTFRQRTGRKARFMAHMDFLLGPDQAGGTFLRAGLKVCKDWGASIATDEELATADVVLSTRQSTIKRIVRQMEAGHDFGLLIIDEAHRAKAPQYRTIIGCVPDAKVLGLTATPEPGDGEGLGGVFETIAYELPLPDAVGMGAVVEPIIKVVPAGLDLSGLRPRGEDFTEAELAERIGHQVNRIAYRTKQVLGPDTPGHWRRYIVFVPGVKAAEATAELLTRKHGMPTAAISGRDSPEEQQRLKDEHRESRIRGLCCADLLVEGHDAPFLGAVVLARPTMSGRVYRQMAQRGGTPLPPHKKNYWLIDLCLNSDGFDLVHPADLWAGPGIPEEALEIARALITTGKATRVSEAIEEARERLAERERRRMTVVAEPPKKHQFHGRIREYRPLAPSQVAAELKSYYEGMRTGT